MKVRSAQLVVLGLFLATVCPCYSQTPSGGQQDRGDVAAPKSSEPADVRAGSKPHDSAFIIGNEDVLAISVWNEPNLTKSIPVRSDGKISMPLIGELQAAGRTPLQLEQEITGKLRNFITAPEVTVIVEKVNSKKFNILGEVAKPGSYSIAQASTIVDAIALAGGFRDFAKKSGVYVLRKGGDGREAKISFNYKQFIKGKDTGQNIQIEPNDTIIVP
jgi:polysaccharide export outer membrane protein